MSISSIGNTTVGQSTTLTCIVISPDPLMDTLTMKWYSSARELKNVTFTRPFETNKAYTLDLHFLKLKASDGGRYECLAVSSLSVLELIQETILERILIVSCKLINM